MQNNKTNRWIYLISTGLLTAMMLMSVGMYFFNYEEISATFAKLGYPTYLVYPLAIVKILGLVVIWLRKPNWLKEWAYAGFFFDFVLAFFAHYAIQDGEYAPSLVAILLLAVSRYFESKN